MLGLTKKLHGLEERVSDLENWRCEVIDKPVVVIIDGDRPPEEQTAALAAAADAHPGRQLHVIRMTVKPAPVLPETPETHDGLKAVL